MYNKLKAKSIILVVALMLVTVNLPMVPSSTASSFDGVSWIKYADVNGAIPVVDVGAPSHQDYPWIGNPSAIRDLEAPANERFKIWFTGSDTRDYHRLRTFYATSPDGINWNKYSDASGAALPVLDLGPSGSYDEDRAAVGTVIKEGNSYRMWYSGIDGSDTARILYATSSDGIIWTKQGVVINVGGSGDRDDWYAYGPKVIIDNNATLSERYKIWYIGKGTGTGGLFKTFHATSSDGIAWTKYSDTNGPIVVIDKGGLPGGLDDDNAVISTVIMDAGIYKAWYVGVKTSTARIFHATSTDGKSWTKHGLALDVGAPGELDDYGASTHCVLKDELSKYHMFYMGVHIEPAGTFNRIFYAYSEPQNQPPVADAGPDQTVNEGDVVQFDGTGSFDPDGGTGNWVPRANIPSPRAGGGSAVLDNEIYYVGGGLGHMGGPGLSDVFQKYTPATDSWSDLINLPQERTLIGAAAVNGKIYAIGGEGEYSTRSTTYEFDPITNTWAEKAPMPIAMSAFGIAVVDDRIYTIGGISSFLNCSVCNSVYEYNTTTDTWSEKNYMPTPRSHLAATTLNGKIYAIGGKTWGATAPTEVYDPSTDTWTTRTSSSTYRWGLCAEALVGKIYVFGGTTGGDLATNKTEVYDPTIDTWATITPMLDIRQEFGSGVVGNSIYAVGGHRGWMTGLPNCSEMFCIRGALTYSWDFDADDGLWWETGAVPDATGPTPTHVYGDNGVYTATLRVTDDTGETDTDECIVSVNNVAPYGRELLVNGNFSMGTDGWNQSLHGYVGPGFIPPLPQSRYFISTNNGYLETGVEDGYNQLYQDVKVNTTDLDFHAKFRAVDFSTDGGLVDVKVRMFCDKPPGWSGNPPNYSNLSIIQSLIVGQISWYFRPDHIYPSSNTSYWELLGNGPSDWYVLDVNLHDVIVAHLPGINESKVKWLRIWVGTYGESGGFTIG